MENDVNRKTSWRKTVLRIFDLFLVIFIITPCCILAWRGTWLLMDYYILPKKSKASCWISLLLGITYSICCHLIQEVLNRTCTRLRTIQVVYIIVTRLYYYLAGVFSISVWRGVWGLLDAYLGKSILNATVSCVLGLIVIIPFRGVSNLSFPPGFLSYDWNEKPFDLFHTRFNMQQRDTTFHEAVKHVADLLVSYILLIPASVVIWRGVWECTDLILYPKNLGMSGIVSTASGYSLFLILLVLNPGVQRISHKLSSFWLLRLIVLQLYAFIQFIAVNSMWRGIFNLLDAFVFPDSKLNRGITAHVIGFGALIILGASRSTGQVSFMVDGADESEPVKYLSHLRKACSNGRYSLLVDASSEDQSQSASDEDENSNTDEITNSNKPDII
ncbi:uncharacterized protein LOC117124976 [Anneissia japonica]|uniref:uncharacterized protein LOC117124976 n=1 Tax=Anneissia japonica TaxID=1529436 RepID=UPI0014256F3F|nr:uncharacterized protein LOC117124976 [Anneissia japonica]